MKPLTPPIPANLRAPVPAVTMPEDMSTQGDLLGFAVDTVLLYGQCRERNRAWTQWAKGTQD